MLTNTDLQEIRKIIKEEVAEEITKALKPIQQDLIKTREQITAEIVRATRPIKEDLAKIRKDLDAITLVFDSEYLNLRKRVDRLERHLQLPSI